MFKEKRYRITTGASLASGAVSLGTTATLFNCFGRGEKALLNVSPTTAITAEFSKPIFTNFTRIGHFSIDGWWRHRPSPLRFAFNSPISFDVVGAVANFCTENHKFSVDVVERSFPVYPHRAAFSWLFEKKTPGDPLDGGGSKVWFKSQMGLVGGKSVSVIPYGKMWAGMRWCIQGWKSLSLSFTAKCGALASCDDLSVIDKFVVGGAQSIRGYPLGNDLSVENSGKAFWEAGISLFFPIAPPLSHHIKGHLFVNGGQVFDRWDHFGANPKYSYGFGIACKALESCRVELNVAFPIEKERSKTFRESIYWGIGMEFL